MSEKARSKPTGAEHVLLEEVRVVLLPHARERQRFQRPRRVLQAAYEASSLPELPDDQTRAALNDLLVRLRLGA